jgi:hypothetical protein
MRPFRSLIPTWDLLLHESLVTHAIQKTSPTPVPSTAPETYNQNPVPITDKNMVHFDDFNVVCIKQLVVIISAYIKWYLLKIYSAVGSASKETK